jgi:RP/EB family microtubule-associated protein
MASADQSISLMDGTYFVGRKEILDWVNSICGLNLAKVEQTCNGAVACQLLDAIYPGKVPMSKVDWSANKDYEYINNYKVLQKCFTNLKIDKHIEVDRLVRGKYQDNLEFMQWFKKFYELNASGQPYEPLSQREKGKGGSAYTSKYGGSGSGSAPSPTTSSNVPVKKPVSASSRMSGTKTAKPPAPPMAVSRTSKTSGLSGKGKSIQNEEEIISILIKHNYFPVSSSTNNSQEKDKELEELNTQCEALTNENGELRSTVSNFTSIISMNFLLF